MVVGEENEDICAVLLLTLSLGVAACPQWLAGTRAVTNGGAVTRLPPPPPATAPYRSRTGLVVVVMAAVPAVATPPPRGGPCDRAPYPARGCQYAHSRRGRPRAR